MDTDEKELPFPQEQVRIEGDERDRLIRQVLEDTDLSKIDHYIRNKGYVRNQYIVHRERYPDHSFTLMTTTIQYRGQGKISTATWKGIPPDRPEEGEITYEDIYERIGLEEALEDTSLDKRRVLPTIVGFIDNGEVGLRVTSDGVEENEVDTEGVLEAAKDAGWDDRDCSI